MELWLLYLFTRLDIVVLVSACLGVGSTICALICFPIVGDYTAQRQAIFSWQKRFIILAAIFGSIAVVTPSQKDMALILGGYAALEASKTDTAQRLASKSVQLIEQTLDSYLKKTEKP